MQTHRSTLTLSFLFLGLFGGLALTGCQQATPPAEEASETSSPVAETEAATDPSVISTEDFESGEVSALGGEPAEGEDAMGAMEPTVDAVPSDPPSDDDDDDGSSHQ